MATVHSNIVAGDRLDGDAAPNLNPSDLSDTVGHFARGDAATVAQAAQAARAAFPAWAAASPQLRADVLERAGLLIAARAEALGELLAREEGKTLAEARGEVQRAAAIFKFFAGEALRLTGETGRSLRQGVDVHVTREPLGVVALITPWNFPIAIPAWKIAPALAYGNTVVLKPAELVPASAHALVEILIEAGAPPGVVNLVMGPGAELGPALVEAAEVEAVSFTGSVATGRTIAARCAALGKRVQCEMGGKNPLVVLDDADLEVAVAAALNGAFFSTGQRCTASSRLIVTDGICDRFVDTLVDRMHRLRVGHALDPATEMGPVVDARQLERNLRYLEIGVSEGARLVGGERLSRATQGHYMAPALFLDTGPHMTINREEIFGPVASVIRVADIEAAIAAANDTDFGLAAGICTTSLRHAQAFRHAAQAGMVMVNLPTAGVDYHVPFGGRKGSSYGPREQGSHAREFYTVVKTAYVAG